jgi:hypothetical protein
MKQHTLALVLALVLSAVAVRAQAPVVSVDLASIGLPNAAYTAVEADGNLATVEWLITSLFSTTRRLMRVSSTGQVCLGPSFTVDHSWLLQRVGVSHEFTRTAWPRFERLPLSAYAPVGCAW